MSTLTSSSTLTGLLSALVSRRTYSHDPAALNDALDFIQTQLAGLPLDIRRLENQGQPCLIATTPAATSPTAPRLWLAAHLDVVPDQPEAFRPEERGGRLYGRGAFDMKYAVACYLRLLQHLGNDLAGYDLGLMITTDEEDSGSHGTQWLVNKLGYRGGAVLLPECGTSWTIETGSKGIMKWQLRATGQAAHASRPWTGDNAIERLMTFYAAVKAQVTAEPCGDDSHIHDTINLGQISGGQVANQVPGAAEALVDVRLAPGTTIAQAKAWFAAAAHQVPGVEAHCLFGTPAIHNRLDDAGKLFQQTVKAVTGRTLIPTLSHGSSDGRYFAVHDIPVISVPPTGAGQHASGEWIDLADLELYYEIIERFTAAWAGPERA